MISILVQRPPADKQGQAITDPLLTSDLAARERGRVEIDRNSTNREQVSVSGPHRLFVPTGTLVEYRGRRSTWFGLVRRCGITLSRDDDSFSADRSFEIEREP